MQETEITQHIAQMIAFFGSKAALARAAKVTPPNVNYWEAGKTKPDSRALHNVQRASKGKFKARDIRPELF